MQSSDESYLPLLETTRPVNAAYAAARGYGYVMRTGTLGPIPYTGNFNRYYLLREQILGGRNDWALWLDADAIVVDHRRSLESIIRCSPDRLLIACRGGHKGDFDINNGVFLMNLRHRRAAELVDACIRYCEGLPATNSEFTSDQRVMHQWLLEHHGPETIPGLVRRYDGDMYNLFNYDGPFIRHVLREVGTFAERLAQLKQLALEAYR